MWNVPFPLQPLVPWRIGIDIAGPRPKIKEKFCLFSFYRNGFGKKWLCR